MPTAYDVVVGGGGPAASVCAFKLARLGWRVQLVHQAPATQVQNTVPEMLAPEGIQLLQRLGLHSAFEDGASSPCCGIVSHWDPDRSERTDLALIRLCQGRMINRLCFDQNLRRLAAVARVEVRAPARLKFVLPRGSAWSSASVHARFIVEATGRVMSPGVPGDDCAKRLYFDRLIAIGFPAPPRLPDDGLLRVAPSSFGWWYTAGLEASGGVAVHLTDQDLLPREHASFSTHIAQQWHEAFDDLASPEARHFIPSRQSHRDARTGCARVLWRRNWLPVGDSAYTVDPLSGFGLTRALRMAENSAFAIHHYLASGTATELCRLALSHVQEFAVAQAAGARLYAACARRFPLSPFWSRRTVANWQLADYPAIRMPAEDAAPVASVGVASEGGHASPPVS